MKESVSPIITGSRVHDEGMTKRELFAAMILQGMYANPEKVTHNRFHAAQDAVMQADALLTSLEDLPVG
jgi:hypothetical protein